MALPRVSDRTLALLAVLLLLLLYLLTLAPGVVSVADDSLEFQLLGWRGAIPHPTGYPLYAILLTLAAHVVPLGEVAFRANLLSALAAAGTAGLTFLVGRAVGMGRVAALVAVALFALAPTFWSQATVAEVYTLHLLLVAATVWGILRWGRGFGEEDSTGERVPLVASFCFGLGLAHHRMIVLWLPALLLYWKLQGGQWRLLLRDPRWVVAGLAPLLLYLWLPLRAHVGSIDGTYSEVGFSCWVRACQYEESFFGRDNALAERVPPSYYMTLTAREIGWPAILLVAGGLLWLWRCSSARWLLLVGGGAINALFAMNYVVPDRDVFWLPTLWVLALLAGGGVQVLWNSTAGVALSKRFPTGAARGVPVLLTGVFLLMLFQRGILAFPAADRSGKTGPPVQDGETFDGRDILAQPFPENAVVIGLLGEVTYLRYLQETLGLAPALDTIAVPTDPPARRFEEVERALAGGRTPFLTRELPGAGERWSLSALGPLVEVMPEPRREVPGGLWPLEMAVHDAVTLAAWTRSPVRTTPLERVTVAWRVDTRVDEVWKVSARLLDANGSLIGQQDEFPLNGAYPTTLWRPGEIILDTYELPISQGGDSFLFILYRAEDGAEVGRAAWTP